MEYIGSVIPRSDVVSFQQQQQQQMYYPSFDKPFVQVIYPNSNKKRGHRLKFGNILYKMAWIGLCISVISLIADSYGIFASVKKYVLQLFKRKDLKEYDNSLETLFGKEITVEFNENYHVTQNISSETDNQIEQSVEFENNNINQDTDNLSPIINGNEQVIETEYPHTINMKRQERRNRYKSEQFMLSPSDTNAEEYVHEHDKQQQQQQVATDLQEETTLNKSQKVVKQLTKKNSATASKLKPWERKKKKKQTSDDNNISND